MTRPRRLIAAVLLAFAACGARVPAHLEVGTIEVGPPSGPSLAATARIELRNGGGRELLLHGVRLDCGCRVAAALPDVLAAGAGTTLVLRCRPGGDLGGRPRAVRIVTSDPERAETDVRVVVPAPGSGVEPPALYFGYVAIGASAVRELALPAAEAEPALPVATDPSLSIEERPPRADGRRVVRVHFSPHAVGPFHAALAVGTRAATVPVSAVAYRSILAFPAEVTVPSEVTAGPPPPVLLKAIGAAPLRITAVETPAGLTGELQATTPGRQFRLVLRVRGGPLESRGAAIVLRTSDPDEPIVTIPLRDGAA